MTPSYVKHEQMYINCACGGGFWSRLSSSELWCPWCRATEHYTVLIKNIQTIPIEEEKENDHMV